MSGFFFMQIPIVKMSFEMYTSCASFIAMLKQINWPRELYKCPSFNNQLLIFKQNLIDLSDGDDRNRSEKNLCPQ